MGKRPLQFIQVKLNRAQAETVLDLIEDELEDGETDAEDRPSLQAAAKIINRGLDSLDARLQRMSG